MILTENTLRILLREMLIKEQDDGSGPSYAGSITLIPHYDAEAVEVTATADAIIKEQPTELPFKVKDSLKIKQIDRVFVDDKEVSNIQCINPWDYKSFIWGSESATIPKTMAWYRIQPYRTLSSYDELNDRNTDFNKYAYPEHLDYLGVIPVETLRKFLDGIPDYNYEDINDIHQKIMSDRDNYPYLGERIERTLGLVESGYFDNIPHMLRHIGILEASRSLQEIPKRIEKYLSEDPLGYDVVDHINPDAACLPFFMTNNSIADDYFNKDLAEVEKLIYGDLVTGEVNSTYESVASDEYPEKVLKMVENSFKTVTMFFVCRGGHGNKDSYYYDLNAFKKDGSHELVKNPSLNKAMRNNTGLTQQHVSQGSALITKTINPQYIHIEPGISRSDAAKIKKWVDYQKKNNREMDCGAPRTLKPDYPFSYGSPVCDRDLINNFPIIAKAMGCIGDDGEPFEVPTVEYTDEIENYCVTPHAKELKRKHPELWNYLCVDIPDAINNNEIEDPFKLPYDPKKHMNYGKDKK